MTPLQRLVAALSASGDLAPQATAMLVLDADPTLEADLEMGAAWREVEAALPESWWLDVSGPWRRQAAQAVATGPVGQQEIGDGPTPALALRALAEALRERS